MTYKEIIFIDSSNNPAPLLQRFGIVSRLILNKNHKKCRVIAHCVAPKGSFPGHQTPGKPAKNKALVDPRKFCNARRSRLGHKQKVTGKSNCWRGD
ncbi:hypothetical protein JTY93_04785 [Pseudomonas hygromyciniae]|uniref:Uncharacterized protein n=1 Tax=Pseudomonas hygromyciniae TaxID=2812000 RepID=A0ABX7JZB1_9PSED|nr:hypothetical protein [Pseudomonas hygromyciniae]MBN0977874.1 hypothetical protein [Pseudomonas hygromyciniae]QSB40714.1 hypothetical protein JTY93_04785 [Pseudomonas hygromyciniae]